MNLNKKIGFLLDKGLNPKFISSLNENKINFLFEKMSKKENNEQVTQVPSKPSFKVGDKGGTLPPNDKGYAIKKNTDNTVTATPMESEIKEDNIKEKFESKAQQGLFWARCNKCKSEDCKWCKMAKEFSKSTSKKQYEKMPEKKHPEKTVKYKKKETKEEFTMANYFDKLTSTYTNNVKNKLTKEEILNKHLTTLVENNLRPTMKKRDLLKLIESEIKRKKGLNEDFYTVEMDEDFMSDDDMDMPTRPRSKMGRLRMGGIDAPTIEPGIREPKIKPKEPDTTPEWTPDEDEPIIPSPNVNPEPQAASKKEKNRLSKVERDQLKRQFYMGLSRMDESTYKPINYRKF